MSERKRTQTSQRPSVHRSAQAWVATIAVLSSLLWFAACGKGGLNTPMQLSPEARAKLAVEPTEPLTPMAPKRPLPAVYNIYQLIDAKISAVTGTNEIGAKIQVQSSAGTEDVELLGAIRADGTASLIDIQPVNSGQQRLAAEAVCLDKTHNDKIIRDGECQKIILNVYYKVGGKTLKKQFVTQPLKVATPVPGSTPLPAVREKDEVFDHGPQNPTDPDDELVGEEQMGEYVGAQPSKVIIDKLWERPVVPEPAPIPDPVEGQYEQVPAPGQGPAPQASAPPAAQPDAQQPAPSQTQPEPKPVAERPPVKGPQQHTEEALEPKKPEPAPAPQSAPQAAPEKKQDEPQPAPRQEDKQEEVKVATPPVPERKPEKNEEKKDEKKEEKPTEDKQADPNFIVPPRKPVYTPKAQEIPKADLSEVEQKIAPFLDLTDGGKAVGFYTDGKIEKATLLPEKGEAFQQVYTERDTHWGTGMIVSMIENASEYLVTKWYPGTVVMIGDVAKKFGGDIGTHASHQSGLDADIPYIGNKGFDRVIANGEVKSSFDYMKNWQFLRLIANQKIVQDGRTTTVLNRVFMNPVIHKGFCAWAQKSDLLKNPLDQEIMSRIRPWEGHDKHFHVRLKCSPHYPACRNQQEPAKFNPNDPCGLGAKKSKSSKAKKSDDGDDA